MDIPEEVEKEMRVEFFAPKGITGPGWDVGGMFKEIYRLRSRVEKMLVALDGIALGECVHIIDHKIGRRCPGCYPMDVARAAAKEAME